MSYLPEISCIICGAAIEEAGMNFSWRTHFRAVYVTQPAPTQAKLSGRGWRTSTNGDVVRVQPGDAPPDHTSGCAHISLMPRTDLAADAAPPETLWGYAFHAACWRVLEEVCFPGKPNVQTLWDACRAMPVDGAGVLNWGHDYAGAVAYVQRERGLLLGEERELDAAVGRGVHRCDPLDVADIRDVLEAVRGAGEFDEGQLGDGPSLLGGSGEGEGFAKLPLEILQIILVNLHTPDVAALRRASRVYAAVPLHGGFWRSRFDRGHEYEHVFEARQPSAVPRGLWRTAYISLKAVSRQSAVRNRKRVWKLASSLQDLLSTMQDGRCEGECSENPA